MLRRGPNPVRCRYVKEDSIKSILAHMDYTQGNGQRHPHVTAHRGHNPIVCKIRYTTHTYDIRPPHRGVCDGACEQLAPWGAADLTGCWSTPDTTQNEHACTQKRDTRASSSASAAQRPPPDPGRMRGRQDSTAPAASLGWRLVTRGRSPARWVVHLERAASRRGDGRLPPTTAARQSIHT